MGDTHPDSRWLLTQRGRRWRGPAPGAASTHGYGIYAILSDADVRARIDALGQGKKLTDIDLAAALRALADELDQHSA